MLTKIWILSVASKTTNLCSVCFRALNQWVALSHILFLLSLNFPYLTGSRLIPFLVHVFFMYLWTVITNKQQGFRRTNLVRWTWLLVYDRITKLVAEGNAFGIIYLDFSKSFDTVSQKISLNWLRYELSFMNWKLTEHP